jgi:hypothetical protein
MLSISACISEQLNSYIYLRDAMLLGIALWAESCNGDTKFKEIFENRVLGFLPITVIKNMLEWAVNFPKQILGSNCFDGLDPEARKMYIMLEKIMKEENPVLEKNLFSLCMKVDKFLTLQNCLTNYCNLLLNSKRYQL